MICKQTPAKKSNHPKNLKVFGTGRQIHLLTQLRNHHPFSSLEAFWKQFQFLFQGTQNFCPSRTSTSTRWAPMPCRPDAGHATWDPNKNHLRNQDENRMNTQYFNHLRNVKKPERIKVEKQHEIKWMILPRNKNVPELCRWVYQAIPGRWMDRWHSTASWQIPRDFHLAQRFQSVRWQARSSCSVQRWWVPGLRMFTGISESFSAQSRLHLTGQTLRFISAKQSFQGLPAKLTHFYHGFHLGQENFEENSSCFYRWSLRCQGCRASSVRPHSSAPAKGTCRKRA